MQQKIIVANWKMNGSIGLIESMACEKNKTEHEVIICPPYPFLLLCCQKISNIKLGAQNCHHKKDGAYTGEVSVPILKEIGCSYVIVGHSERRDYFAETNNLIKQKAELCLEYGLVPIICVGETLEEYESNQTLMVLQKQINQCLPQNSSNIIIAYEPIWAIGSGQAPPTTQIETIYFQLKKIFQGAILYGGSVNAKNGKEILSVVDGALVGGMSLKPEEFREFLS